MIKPYTINHFDRMANQKPRTPWGHADQEEVFTPDVSFFSTPSHGGFKVKGETLKRIPKQYHTSKYHPDWRGWFEEDCEWAIVARYVPELFNDEDREFAEEVISRYFSESY